jgi:hypothetical protein
MELRRSERVRLGIRNEAAARSWEIEMPVWVAVLAVAGCLVALFALVIFGMMHGAGKAIPEPPTKLERQGITPMKAKEQYAEAKTQDKAIADYEYAMRHQENPEGPKDPDETP